MSAYIVSPEHIDVIVSYFVGASRHDGLWCEVDGNWDYLTRDTAGKVADVLWRENVRSVDARYNETNLIGYAFTYISHASRVYTPAEIGKALDGLEYQSCETRDYYETEAYRLLCAMRKHLLSKLADREDADTWHIDTVKSVARVGWSDEE